MLPFNGFDNFIHDSRRYVTKSGGTFSAKIGNIVRNRKTGFVYYQRAGDIKSTCRSKPICFPFVERMSLCTMLIRAGWIYHCDTLKYRIKYITSWSHTMFLLLYTIAAVGAVWYGCQIKCTRICVIFKVNAITFPQNASNVPLVRGWWRGFQGPFY